MFRHRDRRIVVAYSPKRAAKDAKDRQKAVKRLLDKLNNSGKPKSLLPRGVGRFLRLRGKGRWDGLRGVVINVRGRAVETVSRPVAGGARFSRIQARFEGAAHFPLDPKTHPRPSGDRLHGLCLCAASGVPGEAAEKRPLSPEAIRDALLQRRCSILKHVSKPDRYAVPSPATVEAKLIYDALELRITDAPYALK